MQRKSWKQKREASSLHTSSQGSVEKQWHQEKQSQRPGQQKVPHRSSMNNKNYTWLPFLETLITSLGTFSPSHNPAHTKQLPCTGIIVLLVTLAPGFHGKLSLSCQRMNSPVSLVVPCFLCPAARGLHLTKGGLCSPDSHGKAFPSLALEETLKSSEQEALSQLFIL